MIEEYENLVFEQLSYLPLLFLLYFMIGMILTFYWNRDNDGLINATIIFGVFLWPVFLVLFIPEFLSDVKFNHVENNKVYEWNEKYGIGLCIEFVDTDKTVYNGKTIRYAYLNGVMGACVDVRDDKKDGKYNRDYICPLSILRVCGM